MESFRHEHVFRAPSLEAVFAAYFDPRHAVEQDRELDIVERVMLEREETPQQLRRVCRVVPRRQLPAIVRPLLGGGRLHYVETAIWHKRSDLIDLDIRPSFGRVAIVAAYRLSPLPGGLVRRVFEGSVSANVAVLSSRIERHIASEFERSMPITAASTQTFLDRTATAKTNDSAHA